LYAWSGIRHGQAHRHGLGWKVKLGRENSRQPRKLNARIRAEIIRREEEPGMGFLFYANFVRFVLRGGFAIVLVEQARALIRAAGAEAEK